MTSRGFFEPGDPIDLEDFPPPIARNIESGLLIKVADSDKTDVFVLKDCFEAHIVWYHENGYDCFLEGNKADLIEDANQAKFFRDFVLALGHELGVEAYV